MKQPKYAGYLFAYFTGEGTADGEQIRYALSLGNDALHWRELNAGKPVLTSTIGEKGLRDPFVIRSPKGDKFYLIATDLRMYQNSSGSWDDVQRHGKVLDIDVSWFAGGNDGQRLIQWDFHGGRNQVFLVEAVDAHAGPREPLRRAAGQEVGGRVHMRPGVRPHC